MLPKGDISLLYSGGSGGFLFLHWLLLSGQYWCDFGGADTNTVIQQQWNIGDQHWKSTERWPSNNIYSGPAGRIYFHCLSLSGEITQWQQCPGTKVLLYTDFLTQIRMAQFKRAKWFVTDPPVPPIRKLLSQYVVIDGIKLHHRIEPAWNSADVKISLQQLIHSDHNTEQQKLIDHWLSLHPAKLLEKTQLSR